VAGRLRLDLAQFRELEAFAGFGSDLDRQSQMQLRRGQRLVELLKQPQYSPIAVEDQVIAIYAATGGHLDDVPTEDVRRFESGLVEFMRARHPEVVRHIAEQGDLPENVLKDLQNGVEEFKSSFQVTQTAEAARQ
jgi:F-type H+-transporting ATPase subunit alpha